MDVLCVPVLPSSAVIVINQLDVVHLQLFHPTLHFQLLNNLGLASLFSLNLNNKPNMKEKKHWK